MNRLRRLITLVSSVAGRVLVHLVYLLSHVVPRRRDLWAFGSWHGNRFGDNARYLFLYCATHGGQTVRCVWISRSGSIVRRLRRAGFEAYRRWSPRGIASALRAGVYVFDYRSAGIAFPLSGGAAKINLWHGIPLKRIERDIRKVDTPHYRGYHGTWRQRLWRRFQDPQAFERYDYLIAPGPESARRLGPALGVGPERVLITGYPRNDALWGADWTGLAASEREHRVRQRLADERDRGFRILGYLPTWRDASRTRGIRRRVPLPFEELEEVLSAHRARLYCKLHSIDRAELPGVEDCPHIVLLPSATDVYQLLGSLDALISDYSSVYFDYLLLDRPIIFYAYDLESYQRHSRGFYYEYDTVTPGPKAFTPEELVAEVEGLLLDYDRTAAAWQDDRDRVRTAMHGYADGRSSERCLAEMHARLDGLKPSRMGRSRQPIGRRGANGACLPSAE